MQRWARDFTDKLRDRKINIEVVRAVVEHPDIVALHRHGKLRSIGFWSFRQRLIAIWSPLAPSRWVTAFRKSKGRHYLLQQEDAELLWERK
ncbi:MAG: hypothetical protein N3B10_14780 [Armatimonadetes bacterium]|nr:hypothetical protein [Armatimonadota bacterium]MCX7969736.1 hypothetical protein [Armatimonadota bacterium]MDW8144390.1 hypothetical protein [Armatimonadota bacterium]